MYESVSDVPLALKEKKILTLRALAGSNTSGEHVNAIGIKF